MTVPADANGSATPPDASPKRVTHSTVTEYQEQLLGAVPTLSARQVADRAGVSLRDFDAYWLAMGFAPGDPDEVSFTEADVEAFQQWRDLLGEADIDQQTGLSLMRAQSHLTDRLVLWQVEALVENTRRRLDIDDTSARLVTIDDMREVVLALEAQLVYAWRRQMQAMLERSANEVAHRPANHSKRRFPLSRVLGFVDMVSYTSNSSVMGERLVGFIERFEYVCRSAVTAKGGRVVKMIGDAVFFIADDLSTGMQVVTHLMDTLTKTPDILPVRASIVRGDVFSRSGDVFGPAVNLAARLVDVAPTGDVLTDASTAAAIGNAQSDEGYWVRPFPSARLRGFGKVSPYIIGWEGKELTSKSAPSRE